MSQADSLRHIADLWDERDAEIDTLRAQNEGVGEQLVKAIDDIATLRAQLAEVETQRDMEHCECDIALARIAELERERDEPCDDPACNLAEMTVRNELAEVRAQVERLRVDLKVETAISGVRYREMNRLEARTGVLEALLDRWEEIQALPESWAERMKLMNLRREIVAPAPAPAKAYPWVICERCQCGDHSAHSPAGSLPPNGCMWCKCGHGSGCPCAGCNPARREHDPNDLS